MESTYRVEIRGALPQAAREELRRRFGVEARSDGDRTVLPRLTVDQAALRALLGLLWDAGAELYLVRATATAGIDEQGS